MRYLGDIDNSGDNVFDPIQRFTRVRFPSLEAALAFDSAILNAVDSPQETVGRAHGALRAVVFSPGFFGDDDDTIRYLSLGAKRFARRRGIRFVAEREVWRDELPVDVVMVFGDVADRPGV